MSEVAIRRLGSQGLTGEPFASAREAVGWLGAVQAQDYAGAKWALGLRTRGLTDADVDRLFDAGEILRTHVMRPTWHFVLPGDVRWLLQLTAPRVKAATAYADRRLEIDAALLARSHAALAAALGDGAHLTRRELGQVLERSGIAAGGQRLGHLLLHAELDAVVISGPRRGRQLTYALLDERAPGACRLDRDEALAALARRYFTSHGPAQLPDFTWWSGLTAADARRGLEAAGPALAREVIGGRAHWSAPDGRPPGRGRPVVHLLPNYDELLVAYRDRSDALDPRLDTSPLSRGSVLTHVVLVDGRVRGGWTRRLAGERVDVEVGPHGGLDDREAAALDRAVGALERFLGGRLAVTSRA